MRDGRRARTWRWRPARTRSRSGGSTGVQLPRRRVHQPDAGPPRLSRHDGGLRRRQGAAVHASTCTGDGVGGRSTSTPSMGAFMAQAARGRGARAWPTQRRRRRAASMRAHADGRRHRRASSRRRSARCALRSPLIGAFNLENLAVAVGIGVALGLARDAIARGLGSVRGVPGRLERVANDARLRRLRRLRAHARRARAGAGGAAAADARAADRRLRLRRRSRPHQAAEDGARGGARRRSGDRHQRQPAHRGAARDHRDDPRRACARCAAASGDFVVEVDRRRAIGAAIAAARPGDVVLIAGKGHEDYQIVGKTKHHFDDREEAAPRSQKLANAGANGQS